MATQSLSRYPAWTAHGLFLQKMKALLDQQLVLPSARLLLTLHKLFRPGWWIQTYTIQHSSIFSDPFSLQIGSPNKNLYKMHALHRS